MILGSPNYDRLIVRKVDQHPQFNKYDWEYLKPFQVRDGFL